MDIDVSGLERASDVASRGQTQPARLVSIGYSDTNFKCRHRQGGTWMQRWRVPSVRLCRAVLFARETNAADTLIGAIVCPGWLCELGPAGTWLERVAPRSVALRIPRNPLYLGSFLLGSIHDRSRALVLVIVLPQCCWASISVMRVECRLWRNSSAKHIDAMPIRSKLLAEAFSYRDGSTTSFDSRLYLRYREYRAR